MLKLLQWTLLLSLTGCFAARPASNSSGQISTTGGQTWGGSLEGLGLVKVTQASGYTCSTRLFDVLSQFGGDEYSNDCDAKFTVGLDLGKKATGLSGYPTGVQAQGDGSTFAGLNSWPSETFFGAGTYDGPKHTHHSVPVTGGSVTITQFDASKLVGTFDVTGLQTYCGASGTQCNVQMTGSFDIENVDCKP